MKFTEELWNSISGIYTKILSHPFLLGLTDGSLDEKSFQHYAVQDALYLKDFGRGLAILGTRALDDEEFLTFCNHGANAILVERTLHDSFFKNWGLSSEKVYVTEKSPNCLLYTSYLIQVASTRPYFESLGAFIPCYQIYHEVGKELIKKGSPNPLYQKWIDTYASEEFEKVVKQVLEIMEKISLNLTDSQKEEVKKNYILTSKMEYLFWEMGYTKQIWEI
jgi:thiaminase (transcriptional activator TenA)